MEVTAFKSDAPGQLIRNFSRQLTFVPHPLPPQLSIGWKTASLLAEAQQLIGQVLGVGGTLPNPQIVIQSAIRREAELSSRIENTFANLEQLVLFSQAPTPEGQSPAVKEVFNNEQALRHGLEAVGIRKRPLSLSLVKELHRILLDGIGVGEHQPGQFRSVQVFIGKGTRIEDARFVPPPSTHVQELMEALEHFISSAAELPPLVRAALAHYQFETIHPFVDGNGRIGRVLIVLMLCADGILSLPLLNPSHYLEAHRSEYYSRLLDVSRNGQWEAWIDFFLLSVRASATDALARIDRIRRLHGCYVEVIQSGRTPLRSLRLLEELFVQPAITVAQAARVLKVSHVAAQQHVDRLVRVKILKEVTGQRRNRIYVAHGIIRAVEGSEERSR